METVILGLENSHEGNANLYNDWDNNGINDASGPPLQPTSISMESRIAMILILSNDFLWSDWNRDGYNDTQDADSDGYRGTADSHEGNPNLYADWNDNGINDGSEPPPPVDTDRDGYLGSGDSHEGNAALYHDWNNNGINDEEEVGWTFDHTERELYVQVASGDLVESWEETGISVEATQRSWQVWTNPSGGRKASDLSDGPAIGASITVDCEGSVAITGDSVGNTASDGTFVTRVMAGSSGHLVRATAEYQGISATGIGSIRIGSWITIEPKPHRR